MICKWKGGFNRLVKLTDARSALAHPMTVPCLALCDLNRGQQQHQQREGTQFRLFQYMHVLAHPVESKLQVEQQLTKTCTKGKCHACLAGCKCSSSVDLGNAEHVITVIKQSKCTSEKPFYPSQLNAQTCGPDTTASCHTHTCQPVSCSTDHWTESRCP